MSGEGERALVGLRHRLLSGLVIPACPLALTRERRFDDRHQRALMRHKPRGKTKAIGVRGSCCLSHENLRS